MKVDHGRDGKVEQVEVYKLREANNYNYERRKQLLRRDQMLRKEK